MAKAKVTLTCPKCGKSFTRTKEVANSSEKFSWEAWMKANYSGVCPDCYEQEKAAKKAEEIREAGKAFPNLSGSEKQIAWAEKIRHEFLKDAKAEVDASVGQKKKVLHGYYNFFCSRNSAAWWIDNREQMKRGIYSIAYDKLFLDEIKDFVLAERSGKNENG